MLRISKNSLSTLRAFSTYGRILAKNDASTIDSFKLPSQTSINEWEFKYDFMPKVAEPKIPSVSPEAVRKDLAQTKKQQYEQEKLMKELNASIKVEANDASVVHGGESVAATPELIPDHSSDPVDASGHTVYQKQKTANTDKYVQSSLNPEINKPSVVNMGENKVDHKTATVETPLDIENGTEPSAKSSSGPSPAGLLAILGLGGVAGYFIFNKSKEPAKK